MKTREAAEVPTTEEAKRHFTCAKFRSRAAREHHDERVDLISAELRREDVADVGSAEPKSTV